MRQMRDSGVEYIGMMPSNWTIKRLKYILSERNFRSETGTEMLLSVSQYLGVIPSDTIQRTMQANSLIGYKKVHPKDLVFNKLNPVLARFGVSSYSGITSPDFAVYFTDKAETRFLCYLLRTESYITEYGRICTGVGDGFSRLYTPMLYNISVALPLKNQQMIIANFLDSKCAEIDALSADIQSEIETLEAYKQSVITEAVTKGLDKDVQIVESRIFYMAPYNANWTLTKIGYECSKLSRSFEADDIPLLCTNKGKVAIRPEEMSGRMVSEDNAMQGIHKGDIAIHGMDTWHGAIALSDYDGKITRVVHVCDSKHDKRFIVYYLQQLAFNGVYKLISNGVRGNTSDFRSWDKVGDIYIALPSKNEQIKISNYLDNMCSDVEVIVSQKQEQLAVLADYKKSLIYEYVTGKKEVPAS